MKKKMRELLLKSGGKRALKKYNESKRVRSMMNTGTRVHDDKRKKSIRLQEQRIVKRYSGSTVKDISGDM